MAPSMRQTLVLLLLICGVTAPGCGAGSQPLLTPQTIATQVATHYGDPNAAVVTARSDVTEVDSRPMYLMTVRGRLRKNGVEAATIKFSALATRLYVWDVSGFDRSGLLVWSDPEWGVCSAPCRT
jgi:hypothetical protein